MSIITKLSKEDFISIIKKSKCFADVCKNLNLRREGGYYNTIKRRIKRENIDISHFLSISELMKLKEINSHWISKVEFLNRLNNNIPISIDTIKNKLIEFNILPYECYECHITNKWNKKFIRLQLDHKDGNHKNNALNNLRWLCPNCHSQTDTFCGKHKKKINKFCIECGCEIFRTSERCNKCSCIIKGLKRRKVIRPDKNKLQELVCSISMVKIGKMFNVSDNAVRKWCKSYGIKIGGKNRLCSDVKCV